MSKVLDYEVAEAIFGAARASRMTPFAYLDESGQLQQKPCVTRADELEMVERYTRRVTCVVSAPAGFPDGTVLVQHGRTGHRDAPPAEPAAPAEPTARPAPAPEPEPTPQAETAPEPAELPRARKSVEESLNEIDRTLASTIGDSLQTLKRTRQRMRQQLDTLQRQTIQLMREVETRETQIAALENASPRQEFLDGLSRLISDGTVEAVRAAPVPDRAQGHFVVLETKPVVCTRSTDGARFDLGRYDILIDFVDGRVFFQNRDAKHPDYIHPHVGFDGRPCLGNAHEAVTQMIAGFQVVALAGLLLDFLQHANGEDSWGSTVAEWPRLDDGPEAAATDAPANDTADADDKAPTGDASPDDPAADAPSDDDAGETSESAHPAGEAPDIAPQRPASHLPWVRPDSGSSEDT